MSALPLVERDGSEPFARVGEQLISVAEFCADVRAVAEALPDTDHIANLAVDRYRFTVLFFASLARGKTVLLPAQRELSQVRPWLAGSGLTSVSLVSDVDHQVLDQTVQLSPGSHGTAHAPVCEPEHTAAIVFTSGSTGTPKAHRKSWALLDDFRRQHWRQLQTQTDGPLQVIATVPSWHMYGLEWALMLPSAAPVTLFSGADFYPQDVVNAIALAEYPVLLVTTPVHLRALLSATQTHVDNVALVMSATAPLDGSMAEQAEQRFDASVWEIYGCSEIGSVASRTPVTTSAWQFFPWFDCRFTQGAVSLGYAHLPEPVALADRFAQDAEGYLLQGRDTDLVKIGGKRESLARLNALLLSIDGVQDGTFYDPSTYGLPDRGRLGAVVVAPGMSIEQLKGALSQHMASIFLPRPLRLVDALPRDNTSKLKHADMRQFLHTLLNRDGA